MLTQDKFDQWNKKYLQAKASLGNREELVKEAISELENDMELLGITGVEGKPTTLFTLFPTRTIVPKHFLTLFVRQIAK